MKKLLSIVTMLGALSGAASAAPYYAATPAGGDLTPNDIQPVYTLEAIYSIANKSADPDMWGVRGSLSLYSNGEDSFRHQFSLNLAAQWGEEDYSWYGATYSTDFFMLPVTVGYDINIELADDVMFYVGGKAGYTWAQVEDAWGDANGGGFTWAVGAGIKVQCSDSIYVKAGYEFGRTHFSEGDLGGTYGAHTISVGVGCTF